MEVSVLIMLQHWGLGSTTCSKTAKITGFCGRRCGVEGVEAGGVVSRQETVAG